MESTILGIYHQLNSDPWFTSILAVLYVISYYTGAIIG